MHTDSLHVVVAGGAIGGAGIALLLARAGANVTVCEKHCDLRTVGAGIGLAENGLAVLSSLGLEPALRPFLRPVTNARIVDQHGTVLFEPGQPAVSMIRRSALQQVLLDAMAAEPNIEYRGGTKIIDARPDGSARVRGPHGVVDMQADLIIGADGVHSTIRECGSFGMRVHRDGRLYMRALVKPGCARNEEAWTDAGLFGSFDVDDATYVYASAGSEACLDAYERGDFDGFRDIWARAYRPSEQLLADLDGWEDVLINRVYRVECRRWTDGALVLLGDAAHAMPPNLGQGGNSALVDAAVLLDEIRNAHNLPRALARWQHRRMSAVRRLANASSVMGNIAEWRSPFRRWLRDAVLFPISRALPPARSAALILQEKPDELHSIGRS